MTVTRGVATVLSILLALSLSGCEDKQHPKRPRLLPALGGSEAVVLEAEAGKVEASMVVETFASYRHPKTGLQEASGGRCITIPKDANKACKAENKDPAGKVELTFSVPKDGTYYIHPRVWWKDGCSNSLAMAVDTSAAILLTDGIYENWHWFEFKPDDFKSNAPRAFKLKKGEHTITFSNREDDVKLDQVYVTSDPDDRPAGIMQAPE